NDGTLTISNSTFSSNSAYEAFGGGILNDGTLTISTSTLSANSAPDGGGGIYNGDNNAGTLHIGGSIVAGGDCVQGNFIDFGYNLWDCPLGNFYNTDPKLDPNGLQNNGGPTQTIALQQGSPAIDRIPVVYCPATDQRGVARPDDAESTCDIGAYESDYQDNDL